jgi:superfamily II DNA/RNA helicase
MMNRINSSKLIIASDLLSRGIDIKLDLVILFDARNTETFWHRVGRTGRYGRTGVVISLDEIEDTEWQIYDKNEINSVLETIEMEEKKVWFGGHLAEVGKWCDVD